VRRKVDIKHSLLKNSDGMEIHAMNYVGIILSIRDPDRVGKFVDVVLGHETMEEYSPNPFYLLTRRCGRGKR
jgi:aldose 1-epimerase